MKKYITDQRKAAHEYFKKNPTVHKLCKHITEHGRTSRVDQNPERDKRAILSKMDAVSDQDWERACLISQCFRADGAAISHSLDRFFVGGDGGRRWHMQVLECTGYLSCASPTNVGILVACACDCGNTFVRTINQLINNACVDCGRSCPDRAAAGAMSGTMKHKEAEENRKAYFAELREEQEAVRENDRIITQHMKKKPSAADRSPQEKTYISAGPAGTLH